VLIGGVFAVKDGKLQPDVNPGRAIRAPIAK
jgi:N-acyl-D-aspartate/D-glutamate deacylase